MARKNRRINKESERFVPSKELQELLFSKNNKRDDKRHQYKSKPSYKKIS